MSRPVIGICAGLEQAKWSFWDQLANLIPRNYTDAVARAGGLAILIPVDDSLSTDPTQVLDLIDGLMLAGGADIDPAAYGATPDPHTTGSTPARDAAEIAITRQAIHADIPVLGICRGMQLLNVALGGTLIQHLPDSLGHEQHRRHPGTFDDNDHDVRLTPGSIVARLAGEEIHSTKSHHHQGVDRIGDALQITGRAVADDLPEAIELPGKPFVLAVQWHPEADVRSRMVAGLVEAAAARRAGRAAL